MKTFTNIFGKKIENKPFFHTACKVWRVARYENNELDFIYENESFKTEKECLKSCKKTIKNRGRKRRGNNG